MSGSLSPPASVTGWPASTGQPNGGFSSLADRLPDMSWAELFERAAAYETELQTVRSTLSDRRGDD